MATATAKTTIAEVTLTLSPEEARSLLEITYHIGGSPTRSRRQHFDSILEALRAVGVNRVGETKLEERWASITFKDEKGLES